MLRIAICDDEQVFCSQLETMVLEYQLKYNEELTVDVFYSGDKLIEHIQNEHKFDLIFLDIELGTINGVEVGQIIRVRMQDYITKIVYVSSKETYDRQLFDVQPLHFLPKPLNKEKVFNDIQLATKILNKENNLFCFKVGSEMYKIPIKEILYFESIGREIKLVIMNEIIYFYDKIDAIEKRVTSFRFMQPHRSYLVNYDQIISIKSDEIAMSNGVRIPISRLKSKEIKALQITYEEER